MRKSNTTANVPAQTPAPEHDKFYTVEALAQLWDVTPRYVGDLIRSGKLEAGKAGRNWIILHSNAVRFIAAGGSGLESDSPAKPAQRVPKAKQGKEPKAEPEPQPIS